MSDSVDMPTCKQILRGTSPMGGGDCGAPAVVDVKNGTITRTRPLHYDVNQALLTR